MDMQTVVPQAAKLKEHQDNLAKDAPWLPMVIND